MEKLERYDLNCNIFDVYDYDGLSMQELLCQFFTKINECVDFSNSTLDLCGWLVNEGLSHEVATKLSTWLNDGTLENIINVSLFENLNKKIDNVSSQLVHNTNNINTLKNEKVNVANFGVVGDGITDDTEGIINAYKFALSNDMCLYIPKNFKCKITKDISLFGLSSVIAEGIIIGEDYTIEIGYNSNTTYPSNYFINNIQGTLKICGLKTGSVVVNYANKVLLFADSQELDKGSIAYSRFEFGRVIEFEINSRNNGWINENTFYRCRCNKFIMDGDYSHNNNTFYKMTFESIDFQLLNGSWNVFYDCRFEGNNKVVFGENAVENVIYKSWHSAFTSFIRNTALPTYTDNGKNNIILTEHDKCYDKQHIVRVDCNSNNFNTNICYKKENSLGVLKNAGEIISTGLIEIKDNLRVEIATDGDGCFRHSVLVYNSDKQLIQIDTDPGVVNSPSIFGWRGNGLYKTGNKGSCEFAILKDKGAKYFEIIIPAKDSSADTIDFGYIDVYLYQRKGINQVSANVKSKYKNLTGTTYPTTGVWNVGDIVYNSNPSTGRCIGWVCVSTPCTWEDFGVIS